MFCRETSCWSWRRPGIAGAVVVVIIVVLIPLRMDDQAVSKMETLQVTTYFDTQAPPGENAPVRLIDVVHPIGKVQNVRLVPEHAVNHDRWEVVMALNAGDISSVRSDSVVYLKLPDSNQSFAGVSRIPFMEIAAGRAASPPIMDHAVISGKVTYFADILWPRQQPLWRRLNFWGACFSLVVLTVGRIFLVRRGVVVRKNSSVTCKIQKSQGFFVVLP